MLKIHKPKVSIIIVCMNNLQNLYPCLNSIKKFTTCTYETFVVAYLFTDENLRKLKGDYPWIKIIESNEIRGFSENNNLALKQAIGEFCFVLNDDTYFDIPVIDQLISTFNKLPDNIAIVSPKTLNKDGSVQRCGRARYNTITFFLSFLRVLPLYENYSKYTNKKGVFRTFNISGACFMIKTEIFKSLGWFDEKFFFCPEDIALSTLVNKKGYQCYVNADINLTHTKGGTWSKIQMATMPASTKGSIIFYSKGKILNKVFIVAIIIFFRSLNIIYWLLRKFIKDSPKVDALLTANINTVSAALSSNTPKELFIKYYSKLNK